MHPPPIQVLKLHVTQGSNVFEQPISSSTSGPNNVPITNTTFPELLTAFNNEPKGTIFNASIVTTHYPGTFLSGDTLSTPSVSNFVPQQITPILSLASIPNKLTTAAPFSASVTSLSDGLKTYSSSVPQFASIDSSSGVITPVSGGTTTIFVSQAASLDKVYTAAGPVSTQFVVDKTVPTLSIADIPNKLTTAAPFSVSVTSLSDGLKTYSSSHPQFASIDSSSGVITLVGGGSTTIFVSQAASTDGVYTAAGPVLTQLVVDKAVPVLSNFSNIVKNFGDAFQLTPPYSSSDGAFSYTSSDESVATISGTTVTTVGTGTTTVTATQAATRNYTSNGITATFDVNPIAPIFGEFSISPKNFGDAFQLTPPYSSSDGAFSYTSSDESVATISGTTVTTVGTGTTTVTATQAATRNYTSNGITATFDVNPIAPIFGEFSISPKNFGDAFQLTPPYSSSDGAFSYISSNTDVATISGTTVTTVGTGTITVTATQAATRNYKQGIVSATFVVNTTDPMLSNFSDIVKNFGDQSFTLTPPTSNSDGAFSYESSNTDVATISGNMVTIRDAGFTIIKATQAATGSFISNYILTRLDVNPIAPTLSAFTIDSRNFGDAPFDISAITIRHTKLFIRYGGSDWQTRIINNDTSNTNLQSWGPDVQWWNENAAPSNEITMQFRFFAAYVTTFYNITSASCTVVSSFGDLGTYYFVHNGGTSYTGYFFAQTESPGSWNYTLPVAVNRPGSISYTSSNPSVATISGRTVTIIGSGSSTITATQAATNNYTSGTVTASLVVNPGAPTISNFTVPLKTVGDAPFTLSSPTSNSPGSFSYTSSNESVATISGDVVTIVAAGTTTITATQAATTNYTSKTITVTLVANPVTLSNFTVPPKNFGGAPFRLSAPTSNRPGSFSYTSSNPAVATISGDVVTIVAVGTTTITATQAATSNYTSGEITASLVVSRIVTTISNFTISPKNFGGVPFTLSAPTSNNPSSFSYTSSNESVATISGSTVTIVDVGSSTITATQAATTNYTSAQITASLVVGAVVGAPTPTLTGFTISSRDFGSAPFALTPPTSNSPGSFSYTSSDESVATISGSTVTIVGAGSSTITATQATTQNYTSNTITASFVVNRIYPTLTNVQHVFVVYVRNGYGTVGFTLPRPSSNSPGSWSYTMRGVTVGYIIGDTLWTSRSGSTTITGTQAATQNYYSTSFEFDFFAQPIY